MTDTTFAYMAVAMTLGFFIWVLAP